MISYDINNLTAAIYNRLKTDSAGSSVRSALGNGATSVIHAKELSKPLPALPLVALRPGAIPTSERILQQPSFKWFVYDDPAKGYYAINAIVKLIATAYSTAITATGCSIALVEYGDVTQELPPDDTLGLLFRSITISTIVV